MLPPVWFKTAFMLIILILSYDSPVSVLIFPFLKIKKLKIDGAPKVTQLTSAKARLEVRCFASS